MKIKYKILFSLISMVGLLSCVDVVDVSVPSGEEILVVEGVITDQPGPHYVKLSMTAPYFDDASNPTVSDALIILKDNEGTIDTLTEVESGKYSIDKIQGKIGNTYELYIKANNEEYVASAEIRRVPPIDSILFQFEEANEDLELPAGYFPRYFGPEIAGVGDFYRFKVYRNDTLMNEPSDLAFSSDELVDGQYIGDLELDGWRFQTEDKIRIETVSITEDTYQFFLELFIQINNADQAIFANPVANVRTNIKNINPDSKKQAVGYFYGGGLSFKEGIVKDDNSIIK